MITETLATAVLVINELMAANVGTVYSPATNFDSWIELYNPGEESVNLGGLYLTDDEDNLKLWKMPSSLGSIPAKGFKVVWLGSNDIKTDQAPFKLDCDGGTIIVSDGSSQICSVDYPAAMSRTAWACKADGGDEWGWTADATPGATNATAVFAEERLVAPVVSKGSCLFTGTLKFSVDIPEGATLMYTTDGSVPTAPKGNGDGEEQTSPWLDFVINGDCEGDDASSFVCRDGDGDGDIHRITNGVGIDGSRGIKVHSIANPANEWDTQFFIYTPDHVWKVGEKFRFRMSVRADVAATINVQSHSTPGNYIHWQMLENSYYVGTEWMDIEYEGTITSEQVGASGGGGWPWGGWEDPNPDLVGKSLQTIAFNLNVLTGKENNYYFDNISWELYTASEVADEDASQQSKDGQFSTSKTTNYTFRLFQDGYLPSVPVTRSYIRTENKYTIPVISIVGNKKYFTDAKSGIDCDGDGTNGKTGNGQNQPKNYNQDWDRPVNFSLLSPDGEMLFNQDVNISVSGGYTRSQRFRSFKLKSNKVFDGQNRFDYSFFTQKPYTRNKTVLVRNGGNDVWTHNARFMDPALETIIMRSGIDLDVQAYQPVIEYVNGELRGVLNLRETNNDKFVYANWGYDDDEIDAFENFEMKNGTDDVINRILELAKNINGEGVYDELCTLLDIDEFTNYMASELFINNEDWPDNNIKAYRSQFDGRYRFISFDLDYAFELMNHGSDEPFTRFNKYRGEKLASLFFNMLNHDEFRRRFIDTFCLMGGSVYEPTRAGKIVDELLAEVQPMTQMMKQQGINDGHDPDRAAATIKDKLSNRSDKLTNSMKQFAAFQLSNATRQSVVLKADAEGAVILVNGIPVPYTDFKGHLFAPVQLEAKAPAGYTFAGWKKSSSIISTDPVISLPEGSSVSLTACFTALDEEDAPTVRINEVSAANGIYVNEYFKRNDWIELYNTTSEDIDLEGMYLSDDVAEPLKYQIAGPSTVIPAHGHLVVWCDKLEPETQLHAMFKLASVGGDVLLSDADGTLIDRFTYASMNEDQTAGRYPDGADEIFTMNVPTIERANITSSYVILVKEVKGDVNGDGTVDVADISTVLSFMAGTSSVSLAAADVNNDGTVDVADISAILTIMAGN